ncbi:polysulfide reductase chain A [Candidatus Endoriftia persephone str. Guaymas]|jgi:hypothetical protein|uniref:Uncharacterized protein n=3 Tax=Gammaproteobacteria TaxID=1236 RepID=G2FFP9_9GAMM|nr:hypothetical protein [Candidatus Endoriftia persephone]EGV50232.1 hypothetical protein Rifp1Sym_dr00030 [endosymbiont of Riftia pachyptila (vent Ph05)]EGW54465.1 hypothetical protein TevJSym_am00970 [endosymbiont of Tevnia jerichonana (vent Tica)]MBA1331556.1 polysulfide reductase chain A [Candidatus Endoriftia persephone str. Guaymas]USF87165.1 polysulfide reductase chain A [Candidatus Endoriftia persephone]
MRFPQLAMGQRFRFQGRVFTKSGPLTAREEGSQNNQLMRKSAEVELLDNAAPQSEKPQGQLQRQQLESAMRSGLARLRQSAEQVAEVDGRMPVERLLLLVEAELESILKDLS